MTAKPELTAGDLETVLNEVRALWHAALEREGNLAAAVADVVWKATQYGTTEDGDTFAYIVPKGAMHRLVGVAQSNGARVPVSFRAIPEFAECECGHPLDRHAAGSHEGACLNCACIGWVPTGEPTP